MNCVGEKCPCFGRQFIDCHEIGVMCRYANEIVYIDTSPYRDKTKSAFKTLCYAERELKNLELTIENVKKFIKTLQQE